MTASAFAYAAPRSLDEALGLLQAHGDDSSVLAGGQSLGPLLNLRLAVPSTLIDLRHLSSDLGYVHDSGSDVVVGAMCRHAAVEKGEWSGAATLLPKAVSFVGTRAIRARGTVGGSLAHADPAGELGAVMLALDATIVAQSVSGTREISASDFFISVLMTSLEPDELLKEVRIPKGSGRVGTSFSEVTRRVGDFAIGGTGVVLELDQTDNISRLGVGLCGVGSSAVDASDAVRHAVGSNIADVDFDALARDIAASEAVRSRADETDGYVQRVINVTAEQSLREAAAEAQGEGQGA